MEYLNVKSRMQELHVSQVEMILELRKRGCNVQPSMMSSVLRGVITTPKARRILAECEKILQEREDAGRYLKNGQNDTEKKK